MNKVKLGKTGIEVSRLCFGALTVGPLQANMAIEDGASVIAAALSRGVNFIDTAELYKTYPYIKRAMQLTQRFDIVISSKTYAYDKPGASKAVEDARRKINRDYIDIFMLHEQESEHTLLGHREALDFLAECKQRGIIRAVGISTHHVAGVRAALSFPEIEVIHPIINKTGIGIADGNTDDMLNAVKAAHQSGLGVFAMKPLGGGNLITRYDEALDFVLEQDFVHSIALGMQSVSEVEANIAKFKGKSVPNDLKQSLMRNRALHIEGWCSGCQKCICACSQKALAWKGGINVNREKCVLCGYCAAACESFAIKVL